MKGANNHLTMGQRVAYYRRRRGMSQRELGELSGKTESWVQKIETGQMQLDVLSNIRMLSGVLRISMQELLPDEIAPVNSTDSGQSVPGLRRVIYSQRTDDPRVDTMAANEGPSSLQRRVADAWAAYQAGKFAYVVDRMEFILPLAWALSSRSSVTDRPAVQVSLAYAYQVTSGVLSKLGELDLAMTCADRAFNTALGLDDSTVRSSIDRAYAHALAAIGEYDRAEEAARWGATNVPLAGRTPELHSTVGSLHLVGALAAARNHDRGAALRHLELAADAARQLGGDGNYVWTAFGPTNVAIHRVAVDAELGDYRLAAELGQRIDVGHMPTERRVRHQLEVARAVHWQGQPTEAFNLVMAAEAEAPEQVRRHVLTHTLVHEWVASRRMRPTAGLHGLAIRTGVLAR